MRTEKWYNSSEYREKVESDFGHQNQTVWEQQKLKPNHFQYYVLIFSSLLKIYHKSKQW